MAVTPDTQVTLLKCPIELDNSNQITFASASAQHTYFNGLPKLTESNFSYQRKDGVIRFPAHIDSLLEYNYVMYQNTHYTNKWFYCFITKMEYINDSLTLIHIKTDTYQTWMFDITFKRSFVEREHVSDDTIGKHTIDEGLSTGDYLQVTTPEDINSFDTSNMAICVTVTQTPQGVTLGHTQKTINGVYSGLIYCIFSHSEGLPTASQWVTDFINLYDSSDKASAINSIFMVPKSFAINNQHMSVISNYDSSHPERFFYLATDLDSYADIVSEKTISLGSALAESYSPKNNKLKCYPYNYLMVTNNAGTDVIFHYEDFVNNTPKFKVIGDITPGCSFKCVPLNYLKQSDNNSMNSFNYGIAGSKLPICPWVNDVYTNWLVENGLPMAVQVGVGIAALGVGIATGGVGLAVGAVSGASTIASVLTDNYRASLTPDQANGNTTVGDVTYSAGKSGFTAYKMSLRKERAQAIDDYFTMFGYKVNELKVPNRNSRRYWNYIKTIDVNIVGDIPQEDMQEIKNMFNNGITLWHDTSHFLDYSQNNSIVV